MPTINIPKKIISKREDLVILPRIEYELLLKRKGIQEIRLSASERRAIKESEKELKNGSYLNLDELEKYLAHSRSKASRKSR